MVEIGKLNKLKILHFDDNGNERDLLLIEKVNDDWTIVTDDEENSETYETLFNNKDAIRLGKTIANLLLI